MTEMTETADWRTEETLSWTRESAMGARKVDQVGRSGRFGLVWSGRL